MAAGTTVGMGTEMAMGTRVGTKTRTSVEPGTGTAAGPGMGTEAETGTGAGAGPETGTEAEAGSENGDGECRRRKLENPPHHDEIIFRVDEVVVKEGRLPVERPTASGARPDCRSEHVAC